jgi:hypothetical protein
MTEPLLPEQTADDSDRGWGDDRESHGRGWGDEPDGRGDDERLREEVPPHHVDRDR